MRYEGRGGEGGRRERSWPLAKCGKPGISFASYLFIFTSNILWGVLGSKGMRGELISGRGRE